MHGLLIARAPFSQLAANLKYEGHPALWYLWLGTVDRVLGASPWSLPVAEAPISIGILALIWFAAPLPRRVKLLLSLSYFFVLEYGVISRSYSLGVLLLLGAVPLRRSLWGWVLLALAANTAAHVLLVAAALGAVFFMEQRQWKGPAILMLGCAAAVATIYPVAHDLYPTDGAPSGLLATRVAIAFTQLAAALTPAPLVLPFRWQAPPLTLSAVLIGLLGLPIGLSAIKGLWPRLIFAGLYLALLLMATFAYGLSPRHAGMTFIFFVTMLWMHCERGEALPKAAWIWLGATVLAGLPFIATAEVQPFAYSRAVAAWIQQHGLQRELWGAWPGRQGALISAELGRPSLNLEKDCLNTFVRWNYPHEKVRDPMLHIDRTGVRYVISERPLPQGQRIAWFAKAAGWGPAVGLYRFRGSPGPSAPICK